MKDPEYLAAWTLHHMIAEHLTAQKRDYARMFRRYSKDAINAETANLRKHAREMMKYYTPDRAMDFLGYGICGDIAYFYRVYPNALEVYKVQESMSKWKLVKTVAL